MPSRVSGLVGTGDDAIAVGSPEAKPTVPRTRWQRAGSVTGQVGQATAGRFDQGRRGSSGAPVVVAPYGQVASTVVGQSCEGPDLDILRRRTSSHRGIRLLPYVLLRWLG